MKDLDTRIYKLLKQTRWTKDDLVNMLGISKNDLQQRLRKLEEKGVKLERSDGVVYVIDTLGETEYFVYSKAKANTSVQRFVLTSDWHAGSIQHDKEGLEDCIKKATDMGARFVLHSGDLSDGFGVYHGQLNNLSLWKVEDQVGLLAKEINKMGLNVYGIAGNHDYSYTQNTGVRVPYLLGKETKLFHDLGDFQADFVVDGVEIRLIHGAGGNAYAVSYPAQRYLRNLAEGTPDQVPDMLAIGHFHTNIVFDIYGCTVIHPGNFQKPNEFMIRRGIRGVRGCYFVEMQTYSGDIMRYESTFIKAR